MSNATANATFTGTRTIDVIVVMVAGLFFANTLMQPADRSEAIQIYAAEVQAPLKYQD